MLRGWVHLDFNVHRGRRVLSREREDMERLAQYIIRNPFSVEKMWATEPGPASASILFRSGMNKKIGRNFEVFIPWDFIAAISQHIADKRFELVRYYGWYSNKMRGRQAKQADEEVQTEGDAVEAIDVSAHEPRRIPSKEVARVDQEGVGGRPAAVPEVLTGNAHRFAHRPGGCHRAQPAPSRALARGGARAFRHRPAGRNDPFPDYDTEPVMAFSAT